MDIRELAGRILAVIGPGLAGLLGVAADSAAGYVGESSARAATPLAKRVWARLTPWVDRDDTLKAGLEFLAVDPTDDDAAGAARLQLRKLLSSNPALARELENELTSSSRVTIIEGHATGGDVWNGGKIVGVELGHLTD